MVAVNRRNKTEVSQSDMTENPQQDTKSKMVERRGKQSSTSEDQRSRGQMYDLLGFDWHDLSSWQAFVSLMNSPRDPSSLGILRAVFGILMICDAFEERGLANADYKWGDPEECRFPLIDAIQPLPLPWMYVVYLIMVTGALGISIGLLYRLSCLLFIVPYWYLFLLDKSSWNNHSYLYGLCGFLLLFSDANRYFSLDGLFRPGIRNAHVPLWNYCILRAQFFLVYFIAGLKKLDADWVDGYSMQRLSGHWVFKPFTRFLTHDEIDLWVVHRGGLTIDLTIGYLLMFDYTRPLGVVTALMFHGMNSQMFSIGMFPYVMLATTPIFSHVDWPKAFVQGLPSWMQMFIPWKTEPAQKSAACVYPKEEQKQKQQKKKQSGSSNGTNGKKFKLSQKVSAVGVVIYLAIQCFLPYSHFITKGYNNWTNGLYGYSWDMMIHSWSTQHIRITYLNKDNGQTGYLNPDAWTRGNKRWSSHADMTKQYATCIADRLHTYNMSNVELYFDVWRSLNERFQQRMYDMKTDMVAAEWHVLKESTWVMPLLLDLSDWRHKLDEIEQGIYQSSNDTDVVFIADFPGLVLENFVQRDLGNSSIHVLKGKVIVELVDQGVNHTLVEGEKLQLPAGEYHSVHTISPSPSCYMYLYMNTTEIQLNKNISQFEQELLSDGAHHHNKNHSLEEEPDVAKTYRQVKMKQIEMDQRSNQTTWQNLHEFVWQKYKLVVRSVTMTRIAVRSLATGESFEAVFNATIGEDPPLDVLENDM